MPVAVIVIVGGPDGVGAGVGVGVGAGVATGVGVGAEGEADEHAARPTTRIRTKYRNVVSVPAAQPEHGTRYQIFSFEG
jgi:hypothetical protein